MVWNWFFLFANSSPIDYFSLLRNLFFYLSHIIPFSISFPLRIIFLDFYFLILPFDSPSLYLSFSLIHPSLYLSYPLLILPFTYPSLYLSFPLIHSSLYFSFPMIQPFLYLSSPLIFILPFTNAFLYLSFLLIYPSIK